MAGLGNGDPRALEGSIGRTPCTVVSGGLVLLPGGLARVDLLLSSGIISGIGQPGQWRGGVGPDRRVETVELDDSLVVPGLIDGHVHFLGGGGADGVTSRSPELQLRDFTLNGITTAIGMPGFDMVSRNLEGLVAKAGALDAEGITTRIYVGGFRRPLGSLTGNPWRDVYLLDQVVGVKIALCDDKASPWPQLELEELLTGLAWTASATGRPAVLHVHFGGRLSGYQQLVDLVGYGARACTIVITHCNKSPGHLERAVELARAGAWLDLTTMMGPSDGQDGVIGAAEAHRMLVDAGVDRARITMSTDGNGLAPAKTASGWTPYDHRMDTLLGEVRRLVAGGTDWADALAPATVNVATVLGLANKGVIRLGADADLVILGSDSEIRHVFAGGARVVRDGQAEVMGRYERSDGNGDSTRSAGPGA